MENKDTDYIDGDADDFTIFLFSNEPKGKNTIKLELNNPGPGVKIPLHIFQELLMIFTSGMKYLFSNGTGTLNIDDITDENIKLINKYFMSIGFIIIVEIFTIEEYLSNMKLPNYFHKKELIKDDTHIKDIYYEMTSTGKIYRITFNFLK